MTENDDSSESNDHDRDFRDKIAEIEARRADERDAATEDIDLSSATEDIDLGSATDDFRAGLRDAYEAMQPVVENFAEQAQQLIETFGPAATKVRAYQLVGVAVEENLTRVETELVRVTRESADGDDTFRAERRLRNDEEWETLAVLTESEAREHIEPSVPVGDRHSGLRRVRRELETAIDDVDRFASEDPDDEEQAYRRGLRVAYEDGLRRVETLIERAERDARDD